MIDFIKYNKTGQFANVVKQVRDIASYHQIPLPKIVFDGTVKLHGTNAAVLFDESGEFITQSREHIITPEKDNVGFAHFIHNNVNGSRDYLLWVQSLVRFANPDKSGVVQIYGEWAGGDIQKNVGLNKLPKMFYIFKIRIGNTNEATDWIEWNDKLLMLAPHDSIRFIQQYATMKLEIDFNTPGLATPVLTSVTEMVENHCPVAIGECNVRGIEHNNDLIGEGVVWTSNQAESEGVDPRFFQSGEMHFKVKGEKHSVSKVTTLAAVDPEKVKSVAAFVEYALTNIRLNQGVEMLRQRGIEPDRKNTGEFIKWVMLDILSEEGDTLAASMIEPKEINSSVSAKAREFWFNLIDNEVTV